MATVGWTVMLNTPIVTLMDGVRRIVCGNESRRYWRNRRAAPPFLGIAIQIYLDHPEEWRALRLRCLAEDRAMTQHNMRRWHSTTGAPK